MPEKHPEEMEKFFACRSHGYDRHMQENVSSFEDFYRIIAQPIPQTKEPVKILDLGCGTGLELEAILKRAPRALITGIDLSGEMLEKLREKYIDFSSQINLIQGNYLEEDLGQGVFAYAVSVMTLHHLLPGLKQDLYTKIYSALRPGGKYIEGDYYVSPEKEQEFLEKYRALDEEEIMELFEGDEDPTLVRPLSEKDALIYTFANNLRIELPTFNEASVEVYSLNGSLVFRKDQIGHITDVPHLETGLYVVRVINNNQMTTEKVFIRSNR